MPGVRQKKMEEKGKEGRVGRLRRSPVSCCGDAPESTGGGVITHTHKQTRRIHGLYDIN